MAGEPQQAWFSMAPKEQRWMQEHIIHIIHIIHIRMCVSIKSKYILNTAVN